MSQPEARLQRRIQNALRAKFPGCWIVKIHGGPYQSAGVPDLVACIEGRFFAFEVKRPKGRGATPLQLATIDKIRESGGIADVVTSARQAIEIVQRALS